MVVKYLPLRFLSMHFRIQHEYMLLVARGLATSCTVEYSSGIAHLVNSHTMD